MLINHMKKNISIIGCGAIGSELALSVDRDDDRKCNYFIFP